MASRRRANLQSGLTSRPVMEDCEQRILYSAELLPFGVPSGDGEPTVIAVAGEQAKGVETLASDSISAHEERRRHELVIVDANTPNREELLASLQNTLSPDRDLEVVVLEGGSSGIDQISSLLAEYEQLDAVHLISHGSDGSIEVGNDRLDFDGVRQNLQAIRGWSSALADDADLLIYGCDLAATQSGQSLVQSLAALTGADVAASVDLTGEAALGGDWELEYTAGTVDTAVALSVAAQADFAGLLASFTVTNTDDSGAGSLREAIVQANASAGADTIDFAIPGWGVQTVSLSTVLPSITDTVIIDGYSQEGASKNTLTSGYDGNIRIRIDGSGTLAGDGLTLDAGSDGSAVQGLMITGFAGSGLEIRSDGNSITGNWIGTDGVQALGNSNHGILIYNGAGNAIGGTSPEDRNIVSGNVMNGIALYDVGASANTVMGNWVGLDFSGNGAIGNTQTGITISGGAEDNVIGGTVAGSGNVTSGNGENGVYIASDNNAVYGNLIGTNAAATSIVGNGDGGVLIGGTATDNVIGSIDSPNVIAGNRWGVVVGGGSATGNTVSGNTFHDNSVAAIDFDWDGITSNDADDIDAGSNDLLNFPVLDSAKYAEGKLTIAGEARPGALIEFYIADPVTRKWHPVPYGEGRVYLGNTTVSGFFAGIDDPTARQFEVELLVDDLRPGSAITATATDAAGNTSEFSRNVSVGSDPAISIIAAMGSGGGETRVNNETINLQEGAGGRNVAVDGAGNVIVVWTSSGQDGDGEGVFVRRFDAAGNAIGSDVLVNESTAGNQLDANVSANADGSFVVTWTDENSTGGDIYARLFDVDGATVGGEFQVNQNATGTQANSAVATDEWGNFVIVWEDQNGADTTIESRRFYADGTSAGSQETVASASGFDLDAPSVARSASGEFAVAWRDSGQDGDGYGVYARVFDADGVARGSAFAVSTNTTGDQEEIELAFTANGTVVAVWTDYSSSGIVSRIFDAAGAALTSEIAVSQASGYSGFLPDVSSDAEGNFNVVWAADGYDGSSHGIYARRFSAGGVALGNEFRVNSTTAGSQTAPSIASNSAGQFATAWQGSGSGDSLGIFMQQGVLDYQLSESGGTAVFQVVLDRAPSATVTVDLALSDSTEGVLSTPSLSFNAGNWNTPQVVTVTGVDDAQFDRSVSLQLTAALTSTDLSFNSIAAPPVSLVNLDNELVVTTNADVVDGDTSSVDALVASQGSDGAISLREAILASNANADHNRIGFALENPGPQSIVLSSALPAITTQITIDGSSDDSYATNGFRPSIAIDGNDLSGDGFTFSSGSDGSELRGLIVRNFDGIGVSIEADASDIVIAGNYIGALNADGTYAGAALANGANGIYVQGTNAFIGGPDEADRNVIVGNTFNGIEFDAATVATVQGNTIGLDEAGTAAGNDLVGINILNASSDISIGGTGLNEGNVINGGAGTGVMISASAGTTIQGNRIGTDSTGLLDVNGSTASSSRNGIAILSGTTGTLVGGTDAGAGNIISGNNWYGVLLSGSTTTNNTVQGNYIGVAADGETALGNAGGGIALYDGATGNLIGGDSAAAANIISANAGNGIRITLAGTSANAIQGNQIGVDANGVALGNSAEGIFIGTDSADNLIGGTDSGEGNLIAHNGDDGIRIASDAGTGNSLLNNIIRDNDQLAIELGGSGIEVNDPQDTDAGANDLQNHPVIDLVSVNDSSTFISGSLASEPTTKYRLEFVVAGVTGDASGHGEAERIIGEYLVATDGSGDASFSVSFSEIVAPGEMVSALATEIVVAGQVGLDDMLAYGSSSEYAANVAAVDARPVIDLDADDSAGTGAGGYATLFTEDGGSILVADSDATIIDADSATLASMEIVLTNRLDGSDESLTWSTTGTSIAGSVVYAGGTGTLTLSGVDSLANYQQVLRSVRYLNLSDAPDETPRVVTVQASDGVNLSELVSTTIAISPVNDAPSIDSSGQMEFPRLNEDDTNDAGLTVDQIIATAGGDRITDPDTGALEGIGIFTANAGNGKWQYSVDGGSTWTDLGTVSGSATLLLRGQDVVRYVPNGIDNTYANIGFRAWDQTTGTAGTKVSVSMTGGSSSVSSSTESALIYVDRSNGAPSFSNLDGTASYQENGDFVVLDADVTIFDEELVYADDFGGATLTLVRNGTNNADDEFAGSGNVLIDAGVVSLSGSDVASYTQVDGQLVVTFDSGTTHAQVNEVLQSLAYRNTANVPPTSVQIDWTFSDQNSGGQGPGGALQATGASTVNISDVNDPPVISFAESSFVAQEETTSSMNGASVFDPDDGGNAISVRLQVANGMLNVTLSGTATISAGANNSADLTLLGTGSDINTVLTSLQYTGGAGVTGLAADTLTVTANDMGHSGAGGAQQSTDSIAIDITATNDAPINTVPVSIAVDEDVATVLSGFSISDPDAGGADLTTQLEVASGTLSVTLSGAATISAGASGSDDLTIRGSLTDINATLASLTYTGASNLNGVGADSLTMTTNDLGNTGAGGALQDTDSVTIDIDAVNDAPVISAPASVSMLEEETTAIAGINVSDVDAAGAALSTRLQVSHGILYLSLSGAASISSGSIGSSDLTIQGSAADINASLATLAYAAEPDVSGTAADTLTITTDDQGNTGGAPQQDTEDVLIHITGINDAPVNTVPATVTVFEDVATSIGGISIADTDDLGGNLTTRLQVSHGVLDVTLAGAAAVSSGANGSADLTLQGSKADINATLASLIYTGNADVNGVGADTLTVTTDDQGNSGDGGALQDIDTVQIDITSVNDGPINAVPVNAVVFEETEVAIAGVSIADADDLGSILTTRLQVSNGVLLVIPSGAATIASGANGSGDLTIQGTKADINATLATLTYTGNTDVIGVGADTLTVTTNDLGNTGIGGALQDTDDIRIDIGAVNDAPVNTVPVSVAVDEETLTAIAGISIADVDDLGGVMTTRLQVSNGVLNISTSGAATISGGANGSDDLTIQGTKADINASLATVTYTGNAEVTGVNADVLTVTTSDQGNTGRGGAQQDIDSIQIDITAVNDAPVNTVPASATVAEDAATAIAGISIADVDDLGGMLTTRLQVSNGVLQVTLSGAATISAGANDSDDLTLQGSKADINATLATLTYTGSADLNGVGADTLIVTTDDQGNTGSGGAQQDIDTVQIDISAVNDAPVNTVPGSVVVVEETASALAGISIADADDLGGVLTTRLQVSSGVLNVTAAGTAVISAGSNGSADLTIQGTKTDINATLASLSYTDSADLTGVNADVLTVSTNDLGNTGGAAQQDVDAVQIDITAVNDAPANSVPASVVVAEETATSIAGISIADVDDLGGDLTTRLQVGNGVLHVTLSGSASVASGANGSADLTLQGSKADINATLATLTYTGSADLNGVGADTLIVTTDDQGNTGSGGAMQDIDTVQIDITAVNDAPVNTVPASIAVAEDTATLIAGISVADVDDLGGDLTTRLQVSNGVLQVTLSGAATISAGANDSDDLTLQGSKADINATLASLTYTGNADLNGIGADTLTVTTDDQGNTGSGGAQQDSDSIQIDITAVNDAPVNTVPASAVVAEETATAIAGISIADVDDLGGMLTTRLQVSNGVLQVTLSGAAAISAGANDSDDLTLQGSKADINATLATLRYTGSADLNGVGADSLTVTTNDQGNTGSGGAKQDIDTVQIDISAVNDAPVNTVPGSVVVVEETASALAGISIADADDLGGLLSTRLQVTNGVLNVTLAGAASISTGANASADLIIEGTKADINATLATLMYTGDVDLNGVGADTLIVTTDDLGNTGSSGAQQDSDSIQIDITAVNDAPVNTVPASVVAAEETATSIAGISIADVDDLGGDLTTRLQVSNGVLQVTLSGAATISAGANDSDDLTLQGSKADINATLGTLTYTGSGDLNGVGADTLIVTTDDQGNTGSGGAMQDIDTVQIDITAVNDAPVNTVPASITVAEETATSIAGISIADVDDLGGDLTTRLQVSNGVLQVTLSGATTISAGANDSGDLTLQGSKADINATLTTLTYTGNADLNGVGADTLIVTTDDQGNTGGGGAQQDIDTVQIDISAVNDAPVNTVPGSVVVVEETASAVPGISIDDADDLGGLLTTRLQVSSGVLNVAAAGTAVIFAGSNGSADLTIQGTKTDINATLASLSYTGSADLTGVNADVLTVSTNDLGNTGGAAQQDVDAVQIDITAVNDAPANSVPASVVVAEETATSIAGISISDVDDLGGMLTTRLQVGNGVLQVTLSGATTISAGANDSGDLTLRGSKADINATLATLTYTGNANLNGVGADTLIVTTNDLGNTGSGGAQQDSDSIQIDITAVNDAPVNTVPGSTTVIEETSSAVAGISIADVDDLGGDLTTRLQVSNGVLNVTAAGAAVVSAGSNGSADLTIQGTKTDINATLASLIYTGNMDVTGINADVLTVSTNDLGNTGGAAQQDVDTVQIDITAVNDAPVNDVPGSFTATEETASALAGITVSDVDDLGGVLSTRLQVTDGALNVTLAGAALVSAGANDSADLTIEGTKADINATLASLIYTGNAEVNGIGADVLTVTTNDQGNTGSGGAQQDADSIRIDITAVNDAPVNTVPALVSVVEDTATSIAGISIADADDLGGMLTTRLQVSNGVLQVALSGATAITAGANDSDDLTLQGSKADINATLTTLTYLADANLNGMGADALTITTSDQGNSGNGGAQQDTDTVQIDVAPVNDPPVIGVPSRFVVVEDTATALAGLSVADIDDEGAVNLTVRLQVDHGALSLTLSGQAAIVSGADGSSDLTVQGSRNDINASLASLQYVGAQDAAGASADTLTITANDGGNTGSGGAGIAINSVPIDIDAVNDAPENSVSARYSVQEGVVSLLGGISVSDTDIGSNAIVTTLEVAHGVLEFSLVGSTLVVDGASGSSRVSLSGSVADINATLAGLSYTSNAEINGVGADTLMITTTDSGHSGSGGVLQDVDTAMIDVGAVNDNDPVITSDGGGDTALIEMTEELTEITTVTAVDADLPAQELSYAIIGGVDADKFVIDPQTGSLSVADRLDYENPLDADQDNVYEVQVQVDDGQGRTDTQLIAVRVLPANDHAPEFTNLGNDGTFEIAVSENVNTVISAMASDLDSPQQNLAFSIVGGNDAALFTIDETSGLLRFASAPNFEAPSDSNQDNLYEVELRISDGELSDTRSLLVSVLNANEAPTTILPAEISVNESVMPGSKLISLLVEDPDLNDRASFQLVQDPSGLFRLNMDTGELSLANAQSLDFETATRHVLLIRVSDQGGLVHEQTVTVLVEDFPESETSAPAATPSGPATSTPRVETDAPVVSEEEKAPPVSQSTTGSREPELVSDPADETFNTSALFRRGEALPPALQVNVESSRLPTVIRHQSSEVAALDLSISFDWSASLAPVQQTAYAFVPLAPYRVTVEFVESERMVSESEEPETFFELAQDPVKVAGTVLSAGAVWWLTRSGGLITTMLMGIPTWRHLDLLPIVSRPFGDDLEDDHGDDAADADVPFSETVVGALFDTRQSAPRS